jgi:hypothetical protein
MLEAIRFSGFAKSQSVRYGGPAFNLARPMPAGRPSFGPADANRLQVDDYESPS